MMWRRRLTPPFQRFCRFVFYSGMAVGGSIYLFGEEGRDILERTLGGPLRLLFVALLIVGGLCGMFSAAVDRYIGELIGTLPLFTAMGVLGLGLMIGNEGMASRFAIGVILFGTGAHFLGRFHEVNREADKAIRHHRAKQAEGGSNGRAD